MIVVSICLLLVYLNNGIRYYSNRDNTFLNGEEGNFVIDYVTNNIKEDEKLYVYYYSMPLVKYKLGYDNYSIGKYKNNIIYASGFYDNNQNKNDIKKVINTNKCYLMFTHFYYDRAGKMIEETQKNGYLELVYYPYSTPLYYYTKNISDMKTKVQYKIKSAKIKDKKYILTLTIENIGDSILNHEFDNIVVSSRENEKIEIPINKYIYQNQSVDIEIKLDFKNYDEINLQLYNKEHYWFDELGIEPIKITKETFTKKDD